MSPVLAVALGALTVGFLDALDAIVFFGARGVAPGRIFQAIAAGLLGRASFQGGISTVALGIVLHFTVASLIVTVYFVASRRFRVLVRYPFILGPLYGIVAYLVMNFVVIPLSAAGTGARSLPVVINGVLIHMAGVGLPSALFARAATSEIATVAREAVPYDK
jgi:hypothetical protein